MKAVKISCLDEEAAAGFFILVARVAEGGEDGRHVPGQLPLTTDEALRHTPVMRHQGLEIRD